MQDNSSHQLVRQRMPYPIASAWQRAGLSVSDSERIDHLIYCLEITLRTLVAFLLPDYYRASHSDKIDKMISDLSRPSLGIWVGLLRELIKFLYSREDGQSFLEESYLWFFTSNGKPADPSKLLNKLVEFRNRIAHDGPTRSAREEATRVETFNGMLDEFLCSLEWFSSYRSFRVLKQTPTSRKTFTGLLQFFVGELEFTDPVEGEWDAFLVLDKVYLTNADGSRIFELSPFIEIYTDPLTRQDHCYLIKAITQKMEKILRIHDASGSRIETGVSIEGKEITFYEWVQKPPQQLFFQINTDHGGTLSVIRKCAEITIGTILDNRF